MFKYFLNTIYPVTDIQRKHITYGQIIRSSVCAALLRQDGLASATYTEWGCTLCAAYWFPEESGTCDLKWRGKYELKVANVSQPSIGISNRMFLKLSFCKMALQVTFNTHNFSCRLQYWVELYLNPSVKLVFFLWKLH